MSETKINDNLVLIGGSMASGKSLSLMFMDDHNGVMYLNCDSGKKLPFKSKFQTVVITDPMEVYDAFVEAEEMPEIHTIVVDTWNFLMDMYELTYVSESANTQQAWGDYSKFVNKFFLDYVANSTKNVIILGHTMDILNESDQVMEKFVGGKGAVMKKGIEGFFSTVLSAKKVPLKKLKDYGSDLLTITEEDEMLGFKYVFQTRLTKDTVNERLRSSLHMWSIKETYIDNNIQSVINRLHEYYEDED